EKDVQTICNDFLSKSKPLTYDNLHTINTHLMNQAVQFTEVIMVLERYFVGKEKKKLRTNKKNIPFSKIVGLRTYDEDGMLRNKAFHFGVPEQPYRRYLFDIEKKFIANEIKPTDAARWEDIPKEARNVLDQLLKLLHDHFFDIRVGDRKARKIQAQEKYVRDILHFGRFSSKS